MSRSLPISRNSEGGFSLLEVLIATAILAVVMAISYQIISGVTQASKRVEQRSAVFHSARISLDKIGRDVEMAFLLKGEGHAGDRQGSEQLKTQFKGDDDAMDFASLSHFRMFQDTRESDTCEVGYKIENDPEGGDFKVLMRRESRWIDADPEEGGEWKILARRLKEMKLEYYDDKKRDWQSSWDSVSDAQDRLPRAVRVVLTFAHPTKEGDEMVFSTVATTGLYKDAISF